MALDKCPHMAARCPHKESRCHGAKSKQCHYVTTATASAFSTIAALQALGLEQLSETQREHLNSMKELIASLEEPPDSPI